MNPAILAGLLALGFHGTEMERQSQEAYQVGSGSSLSDGLQVRRLASVGAGLSLASIAGGLLEKDKARKGEHLAPFAIGAVLFSVGATAIVLDQKPSNFNAVDVGLGALSLSIFRWEWKF